MEAVKEEKELFLIKGPDHAISLLLGFVPPADFFDTDRSNDLKKKDLSLYPDTLLGLYKQGGRGRKYKQINTLIELAKQCKTLNASDDKRIQLLNTRAFLSNLLDRLHPEFANKSFLTALSKFILKTFFGNQSLTPSEIETAGFVLLNQINDQLHLMGGEALIPFREPKAPKMDNKARFKNYVSESINEKKATWSQMSEHIWLGKKPNATNVEEINSVSQPRLVVSAIQKKETQVHFKSRKTTSQFFWAARHVGNCLVEIPDFGKPNNEETYREMYYTCRAMAEVIKRGENVYIHCKAGKGRSVMTLGLFYLLDLAPEELAKLGVACNIEAIWKHMVSRRAHIDNDEPSRAAVLRAHAYIQKNREALDKITPFEYFRSKGIDSGVQSVPSLTTNSKNPAPPIPSREGREERKSPSMRNSRDSSSE